jgi:SAM-dependent methyltransferase
MSGFYDTLALHMGREKVLCLNYGYLESADERFDWLAPEDLPEKYSFNLMRRLLADLPLAGKTVVEVGSGRGGNCLYLARYTGAGRIYGVDRSLAHVRLSRGLVPSGAAHFLVGEAESLALGSGTVDLVASVSALHDYRDVARFVAEVRRVLKPGGHFYCTDFWEVRQLPHDWEAIAAALRGGGLELTAEEDISRQVMTAILQEDGISSRMRAAAEPESRALVERLCELTDALGATLAFRAGTYRIWRFHKPAEPASIEKEEEHE